METGDSEPPSSQDSCCTEAPAALGRTSPFEDAGGPGPSSWRELSQRAQQAPADSLLPLQVRSERRVCCAR